MTRGKEREVDGVRKEKERLTAADNNFSLALFGQRRYFSLDPGA